MSSYCSSSHVGVLLNKTFDATSTPTSTQVDVIIDQTTNEIDTVLYSIGVTSQPTDTNLLGILEKYCSFGSAGAVGMAYFRNAGGVEKTNADWYYSKYEWFLKELKESPELFGIVSDAETMIISNQVLDGTYTEEEQQAIMISSEGYEV